MGIKFSPGCECCGGIYGIVFDYNLFFPPGPYNKANTYGFEMKLNGAVFNSASFGLGLFQDDFFSSLAYYQYEFWTDPNTGLGRALNPLTGGGFGTYNNTFGNQGKSDYLKENLYIDGSINELILTPLEYIPQGKKYILLWITIFKAVSAQNPVGIESVSTPFTTWGVNINTPFGDPPQNIFPPQLSVKFTIQDLQLLILSKTPAINT